MSDKLWNVGLPNNIKPWRYGFYIMEITFDTLATVLAVTVIRLCWKKQSLHSNLRFLIANLFVAICFVTITRLILIVNIFNYGTIYSSTIQHYIMFIHDYAITFGMIVHLMLAFERLLATLKAKVYERQKCIEIIVCGYLFVWFLVNILSFGKETKVLGLLPMLSIYILVDIATAVLYIIIFLINRTQQNKNLTVTLSEKYQIYENWQSLYPLIPLNILHFLHNCEIDILKALMVFYVVPSNSEEMHSISVFNASTAFFYCNFSLPFFVKRKMFKDIKVRIGEVFSHKFQKVSPYAVNQVSPMQKINEAEYHFQQLAELWV
uniref:Gustatory receptor n=1 Tax=Panagrolaimus sp. PS1159 TaxID=55785 RepID=A0AC35F195_9BILA